MLCQVPDTPERIELEDHCLHFPFGNPTRVHSRETLHVQITFSTINKIKNLNLIIPTSTYQLSNITHAWIDHNWCADLLRSEHTAKIETVSKHQS